MVIAVELGTSKRGRRTRRFSLHPAGRLQIRVPEAEPDPGPDWAGQIAGAPLVTPAFEKEPADGAIVRVATQAAVDSKLKAPICAGTRTASPRW